MESPRHDVCGQVFGNLFQFFLDYTDGVGIVGSEEVTALVCSYGFILNIPSGEIGEVWNQYEQLTREWKSVVHQLRGTHQKEI